MLSVDVPNSSLVLGTSASSGLSHGLVHPTQCVEKDPRAEEKEVNLSEEVKRSNVEYKTSKRPTSRARIQFFSLCWTLFLAGWSDASTGPLLPRIQSTYHVPCLSLSSLDKQIIGLFRLALPSSPLFSYPIASCAEKFFILRRPMTLTGLLPGMPHWFYAKRCIGRQVGLWESALPFQRQSCRRQSLIGHRPWIGRANGRFWHQSVCTPVPRFCHGLCYQWVRLIATGCTC